MDIKQACEYLGVSRMTLLRRIGEGKIAPLPKPAALKRHRKLEFRRADVERLAGAAR